MTEATWVTNADGTVKLRLADGTLVTPSAMDIFEAEFEPTSIVSGFEVSTPSADLPSIVFHPNPPSLQVVIQKSNQSVLVGLKLVGTNYGTLFSWPTKDQLLVGNEWFPLDNRALEDLRDALEDLNVELGSSINARNYLDLVWDSRIDTVVENETEIVEQFQKSTGEFNFDPMLLNAKLYPYQVTGSEFLVEMASQGLGVLLADEMGLGKTMQAMYLTAFTSARRSKPVLVVAPSSTMANWRREFEKFAPALKVLPHGGNNRSGDPAYVSAWDVVLTSYDLVTRDIGLFVMVDWGAVILDEAQFIKNPMAQRSEAVKRIPRDVGIAVTGTPIENSLTDMWSIFQFIAPQYLGSLTNFKFNYPDESAAAAALSHLVSPLSIRRTVMNVAGDLPPRVDIVTPVYASDNLAALYDSIRLQEDLPALAKITKLRQVCSAPFSADPGWGRRLIDFPKVDRLLELMESVVSDGSKALVFSSFTESIDELCFEIKARFSNLFVRSIDGRRSPSQRQDDIDEFSRTEEPAVLVLNPQAAGVGLNIQAANYVFHFTPEWNPAKVEQASARAHRRGQDKHVFVYYLYYVGSVEEVMMERLDRKRELQSAGTSAFQSDPSAGEIARVLQLSPSSLYGG